MEPASTWSPGRVEAALRRWLQEHGVASYDPYDGLDCAWPWSLVRRSRLAARVWTQAIKRSPLNVRPLVGIRPRVGAKSYVDLAAAALLRRRLGSDAAAGAEARRCLQALRDAALPGYAGACWGLPAPYVTRYIDVGRETPNLFWCVCAAATFLDAYELDGGAADLAVARSVADFVLRDLGCVDEGSRGVWFRYYPGHEATVYNVTALTGALLLRLARHTGEDDLAALGRRALQFVVTDQKDDGSWDYARGPQGRWVDGFHTGYVLEALLTAVLLEGDPRLEAALRRGVSFYREHLFTRTHLPCYTADRLYPIEVQNCAQAIQTLAQLCWWEDASAAVAADVAAAVTQALFRRTREGAEEAGYFVMSRGRWFTNALATVRWGQAPMLRAHAALLAAAARLPPPWQEAERAR